MHSIAVTTLLLALSALAMPAHADLFIENATRECVKYEFNKKKDSYKTVAEMQAGRKSIKYSCERTVKSSCRDHDSSYCQSLLSRYRGNEPERNRYYPQKKKKQTIIIHEDKEAEQKKKYELYLEQLRQQYR